MQPADLIALVTIALTWTYGWWVGCRWVLNSGVDERASQWALGTVFPTAGLILSVHLPATASLILGGAWINPPVVAAVFLLVSFLGSRFVGGQPASLSTGIPAEADPTVRVRLGWWWVPVAVVVATYAVFTLDAITRYPTGYDTLSYHLPSAVRWMQQGRMDLTVGLPTHSVQENGMIVPFLLCFTKLERLLTTVHLPKALLLAAVTYSLTRALGVSGLGSVMAGCIALSVPMVLFQSYSGYVDLYAAASWLAALLALIWAMRAANERQRRGLFIIAGLSAGIALGARPTYLLMTPALIPIIVAERWLRSPKSAVLNCRPVRNTAVFCLAVLACSGFWMLRGAVQAGNPVYPMEVSVAGRTIFPGCFDVVDHFPERTLSRRFSRWWDYPWRETKHSGRGASPGYTYSRNNANGAAYAAFVPLGMLAAMVSIFTGRLRSRADRWKFTYVAVALSGVALVPTLYQEMLRYALPQILIAIPVAAVLIDRLIVRNPRSMWTILTAALLLTAAIATLKPASAFAGRVRDGRWDRSWLYQIPGQIDELEVGSRILNLSDPNLCYPLGGRDLGHIVIGPLHWEMLVAQGGMSADALSRHKIDYVFVREPWPEDWPTDLPLDLIYDDTETRTLKTTPAARIYRRSGD